MADNEFYEVIFNKKKNLLSVKLKGFWKDEELYDKMAKEFEVNLSKTSPGWKMIIDLTDFLTPPQNFLEKIKETQKLLKEHRLRKIAEVLPKSVIAKLAINKLTSESGFERHLFSNTIEVLKWLES
ncbi:MAG: hypothetical protein ACFE8G_13680 [Candidatus Hermodarchaeota archaeon]